MICFKKRKHLLVLTNNFKNNIKCGYSEGKVSVIAKLWNGVWPRPHPLIQLGRWSKASHRRRLLSGPLHIGLKILQVAIFQPTLISIERKWTLSACCNLYLLLHLRRKTFFLSHFNIVAITGVYLLCRC